MELHAGHQAFVFFAAVLSGAVCGLLYDFFKLFRRYLRLGSAFAFVTDVLFWLLSAVIIFVTGFKTADGELRAFQFVGASLGAVIYFAALSRVTELFAEKSLRLLLKIFITVLKPIAFFVGFVKKILHHTENRCGKIGLIVMFYHRRFRKKIHIIKKIKKST